MPHHFCTVMKTQTYEAAVPSDLVSLLHLERTDESWLLSAEGHCPSSSGVCAFACRRQHACHYHQRVLFHSDHLDDVVVIATLSFHQQLGHPKFVVHWHWKGSKSKLLRSLVVRLLSALLRVSQLLHWQDTANRVQCVSGSSFAPRAIFVDKKLSILKKRTVTRLTGGREE